MGLETNDSIIVFCSNENVVMRVAERATEIADVIERDQSLMHPFTSVMIDEDNKRTEKVLYVRLDEILVAEPFSDE